MVSLYAAKHNPFVYFQSVQEGFNPNNTMDNVVGFDGPNGPYLLDLAAGRCQPFHSLSPNQCNDQHGQGNAGPFCNYDPTIDGTQAGLNPALLIRGDMAVRTLVDAIHNSPAWKTGSNAIVIVWDENDYSFAPNINQVVLIVDRNYGSPVSQAARCTTTSRC